MTRFCEILQLLEKLCDPLYLNICGQSYKASTIIMYDSSVVPDFKIPHITTLDS